MKSHEDENKHLIKCRSDFGQSRFFFFLLFLSSAQFLQFFSVTCKGQHLERHVESSYALYRLSVQVLKICRFNEATWICPNEEEEDEEEERR